MIVDFLEKNWEWLVTNALEASVLILISASSTFFITRFIYKERIETQKEKEGLLEAKLKFLDHGKVEQSNSSVKEFAFPKQGRHGANILNPHTTRVTVSEKICLLSHIPEDNELTVVLEVDTIDSPEANKLNSWSFDPFKVKGWEAEDIETSELSIKQIFSTSSSVSDLPIKFYCPLQLNIYAYYNNKQQAEWRNVVTVTN